MVARQIENNIYMVESPLWGDFDKEVVDDLIKAIDINFSKVLGLQPFSTKTVIIEHKEIADTFPEIRNINCWHSILLTVERGNYWAQWIYQFSHEYCHHFVNGMMTGEIRGLVWFEETLCELASMYQLYLIAEQWVDSQNIKERSFVPSLREYLQNLRKGKPIQYNLPNIGDKQWFDAWNKYLSQPNKYERNLYNRIADVLFPIFVDNPQLWTIILHLGNSRQWSSLRYFFETLHSKLSDDVQTPLENVEEIFQFK